MLQVPSVTMNGGSRRQRDQRAVDRSRRRAPTTRPSGKAIATGTPASDGQPAHDHRGQDHDRADRQVDAGGQDDQGLRDPDDADDRDLLQDQRQVEGVEEAVADDRR